MYYFYYLGGKALKDFLRSDDPLIADSESHYHTYYIPKKGKKGMRMISAPDDDLKHIQKRLTYWLREVKADKTSAAYEKGCSTRENAKKHIRSKYVLHADIKDFFPSINKNMFLRTYWRRLNPEELESLWRLCSYKGGLPIGAPTSPFIANRIMKETDKKLRKLKGVKYTRYADDMIFSSKKKIDDGITLKIERILQENGFELNWSKTYFMHSRREITGVIVTNEGNLSTGTSFKKQLKGEIYKLLVKKEGQKDRVRGRLAYLYSIEPAYAKALREKYGALDDIELFKGID